MVRESAAVSVAADDPFLRACRGEAAARVPVWFMRQAGRSLPEYHKVRGEGSILDAIRRPDVSAEITMQPVHRYGVDAAVLYSDIVVPVAAIGFGVDVAPGTGPVVADPFRSRADLDRLRPLDPEVDTGYVLETIGILVETLDVPLIGFAGAPFTVASYLVEGGPSRHFPRMRQLMYADPELFADLLDRLADLAIASLRSQIAAGVSAIQLFDSWVGASSVEDYVRHVMPASAKVFAGIADLSVPRIHYGVDTGELLELMRDAGADVVGIDWRVPIAEARRRLGPTTGVQGNLDPFAVTSAPWSVVEAKTNAILDANAGAPGHIFNLGWGVQPETDPDVLARVVDLVHERD